MVSMTVQSKVHGTPESPVRSPPIPTTSPSPSSMSLRARARTVACTAVSRAPSVSTAALPAMCTRIPFTTRDPRSSPLREGGGEVRPHGRLGRFGEGRRGLGSRSNSTGSNVVRALPGEPWPPLLCLGRSGERVGSFESTGSQRYLRATRTTRGHVWGGMLPTRCCTGGADQCLKYPLHPVRPRWWFIELSVTSAGGLLATRPTVVRNVRRGWLRLAWLGLPLHWFDVAQAGSVALWRTRDLRLHTGRRRLGRTAEHLCPAFALQPRLHVV